MASRNQKTDDNASSARTKVVGVRLDPKLRFTMELVARHRGQTLSSAIEWAISQATRNARVATDREHLDLDIDEDASLPTAYEVADECWDIDEARRLLKMVERAHVLLTYEEQNLVKSIQRVVTSLFGIELRDILLEYPSTRQRNASTREIIRALWVTDYLQKNFELIKDIARNNASISDLPSASPTLKTIAQTTHWRWQQDG